MYLNIILNTLYLTMIIERDPFVDKNKANLNDGKIDYSHIIQHKSVQSVHTEANADVITISIQPSIRVIGQYTNTQTGNHVFKVNNDIINQGIQTDDRGDDNFRFDNGKSIYWRLLSFGVKIINKSSDGVSGGYIETFDEALTNSYISRRDNNDISFYDSKLNDYIDQQNRQQLLNSPHYQIFNTEELEFDQEFIGTRISNIHDFILLPQYLPMLSDYRRADRPLSLQDSTLVSDRYYDKTFRKKFLFYICLQIIVMKFILFIIMNILMLMCQILTIIILR